MSTVWHVLGHLEFSMRFCIFGTPKIAINDPNFQKILHTQPCTLVVSYFQGWFLILWGTWKKNHENSGHFWHHTPRCAGKEKIRYFYLKFHCFSNFKLNFHLQLQLQSLRWYDMFLLHFLSSTKVSLAFFGQFCTVLEIRIFEDGRSMGGPRVVQKRVYNDKLTWCQSHILTLHGAGDIWVQS